MIPKLIGVTTIEVGSSSDLVAYLYSIESSYINWGSQVDISPENIEVIDIVFNIYILI